MLAGGDVFYHSHAFKRINDGIEQIYASARTAEHAADVARVVGTLIGADSCSYNHFGPGGRLAWSVEPADAADFPGSEEAFRLHLDEHPVLAHHKRTSDGSAMRISDFLSDLQFRELGLYRDFYRKRGVNHQLAMSVAGPDGGLIGVALNRQRSDFSDDDVQLLESLRNNVRQAAEFSSLLPPVLRDPSGRPLLTSREQQILQLVAVGDANKEIASALEIKHRTVDNHLRNIYRKLHVTSRTAAVAYFRTGVHPRRPARLSLSHAARDPRVRLDRAAPGATRR
jgi:DNA-binding CsgD family transcriptional regulator